MTGLTNAGKAAEMLSIPEMHNGNPVTRITGYALSGAKCHGITIPNSVRHISGYAFSGCAALKSATLPEGLRSMGLQSFFNCTSLGEVTLPDSLRETGNYDYSYGYFAGCTSMTNLVIGSGIPVVKKFHLPFASTNAFTVTVNGSGTTVIDGKAFMNTIAGSIVLNGVASIGTSSGTDGAFLGKSEIKSGSGGNIVAFPSETSSRKFYKLAAE